MRPSDRARSTVQTWTRWRELSALDADLRVAVLASYTAAPLVPHLGCGLHEAGLHAEVFVGPYHQIGQQCIDLDSDTARAQPDVLLVLPRFEEYWSDLPGSPASADTDYADRLLEVADLSMAAAARWNALLVFVLPALPEGRPSGVGDHGLLRGVTATAAAVREELRNRLGARPNVDLLDAEAVVRVLGASNVHSPAMMRFAAIPYTEDFFVEMGEQVARLLRMRLGDEDAPVVIDVDTMLFGQGLEVAGDAARAPFEGGESGRWLLGRLRRAGVRIVAVSSQPLARLVSAMRGAFGEDWEDVTDDWEFVDAAGVPDVARALLTADAGCWPDTPRVVELGPDPELWEARLTTTAVWDALPPLGQARAGRLGGGRPSPPGVLTLSDYVAGLGVCVTWRTLSAPEVPLIADLALRAKDFTLGVPQDEDTLGEYVAGGAATLLIGHVTDRLADHGNAVAVDLRFQDGICSVDMFSISCPALGRGVEQTTMAEILRLAAAQGSQAVRFRFAPTGRNEAALRFLKAALAGHGAAEPVRLELEELPATAVVR